MRDNTVSIILQSTVGGFSDAFMRELPLVEKAMVAHGLEPSQFIISKDRACPASIPFTGTYYEYTVYFGKAHFTVTEPNDMLFLDYLYKRCVAVDDEPQRAPPRQPPGLIQRIFRWMAQPI